jgi:hypothetical protein
LRGIAAVGTEVTKTFGKHNQTVLVAKAQDHALELHARKVKLK